MSDTPKPPLTSGSKPGKSKALIVGISIAGLFVLVAGAVAVIRVVNELAPVVSTVTDSVKKNADYPERVAALEATKRTFALGETMQFGPVSLKPTAITRNIQPTPDELAYIEKQHGAKESAEDRAYYGLEGEGQYVQVRFQVQYDTSIADSLPKVTYGNGEGFVDEFRYADLDGSAELIYWLGGTIGKSAKAEKEMVDRVKAGEPLELIYLFRVPADAKGQFTLNTNIYTKVSSIVGTEGMPTKDLNYTLQLW